MSVRRAFLTSGQAIAAARFPSNDCAILQGRSGEILDLKGFQGRHGE
jgi:hypothetical protein